MRICLWVLALVSFCMPSSVYSVWNQSSDILLQETALIMLPGFQKEEWKSISYDLKTKYGIVEAIRKEENVYNWSSLICIQYFDKSIFGPKESKSVKNLLNHVRLQTVSRYPGNKVTWNILEDNKGCDTIYEWILHKPYQDVLAQHEISRMILTDSGFHRVGITKRGSEMDLKEREKWISILKEHVSVVSFTSPSCRDGISLSKDNALEQGF